MNVFFLTSLTKKKLSNRTQNGIGWPSRLRWILTCRYRMNHIRKVIFLLNSQGEIIPRNNFIPGEMEETEQPFGLFV